MWSRLENRLCFLLESSSLVSKVTLITAYTCWLVWAVSQFLARFVLFFDALCPLCNVTYCFILTGVHLGLSIISRKLYLCTLYVLQLTTTAICKYFIPIMFLQLQIWQCHIMTCNYSMATNTYVLKWYEIKEGQNVIN